MVQMQALALTLAVELPVLCVLARRLPGPAWRTALAGALASGLTHPVAWRAASVLAAEGYLQGLAAIEAAVVATEALVLALLLHPGTRAALTWSLTINASSVTVGWLLQ